MTQAATATAAPTARPTVRFQVLGDAWNLYRMEWLTWSLSTLAAIAAAGAGELILRIVWLAARSSYFGWFLGHGSPDDSFLFWLARISMAGLLAGGAVRMALGQIRGRRPRVMDLFEVPDNWFDLALGSVLMAVLVSFGLAVLVIPGLIAAGLLMLTFPLIVDAELPATGAMIKSYHTLKAEWLPITIFHLFLAAAAGCGVFFLGVGVLVTAPLYVLSLALFYEEIGRRGYSQL
ncbi:MAG: hypothetical protein P4L85_27305 [Paludisphaera borealis]|uniref:hypothetical protein n=1 Tax=Paludisphaera borealis TaxID=1387353 RepID=UPI0028422E65|nr:hypothetical protein [Paludisphaera borealis]MDR3623091.1 hypothetical protein [Paludisphaera borealis]